MEFFDKADTLLRAVAYQYSAETAQGSFDAKRFNDYLRRALAWSTNFDNIGFVDATGMYLYGRGSGAIVDLRDREFFTRLRDRPEGSGSGDMIFSQPLFTRLSEQWALVLARRIERSDGSFGGIVMIRWDVDRLSKLLASVDMGKGGLLVLRAMDMQQISRFPESQDPAFAPGNTTVPPALKDLIEESPRSGFLTSFSSLDGVQRYYAYNRVNDYPFYVVAGKLKDNMVQDWRNGDLTLLVLSLLMIAVVLFGAQHMSRLTKKRIRFELDNFAQRVLNASPVAMVLLDKVGVVAKANPAAQRLFHFDDDEMVGLSSEKLQPEDTAPTPMQRLRDRQEETGLVREAPYQRKDGSNFIALRAVSAIPEASGEVSFYLETVVDITELKHLQDKLREHAETDQLTGLLNRRSGDLVLEQAIHDADINDTSCAVILGDIDYFKRVNDTYGHLVGDRILTNVSHQIKSAIRAEDHCIRWGGEEFLIVLPRCSPLRAQKMAERICREIESLNDEQVGSVTISFGVSAWVRPEKPSSLVAKADRALYRAKWLGRNRVEMAQQES